MKHRLVGIGTPNARIIISLLPCTTKRKSDIGTMTDVTVEASRGCFVIGSPKPNAGLKIVVDAPKGTVPLEIGWVCEGRSGATVPVRYLGHYGEDTNSTVDGNR